MSNIIPLRRADPESSVDIKAIRYALNASLSSVEQLVVNHHSTGLSAEDVAELHKKIVDAFDCIQRLSLQNGVR
ncbi:MAG: hypothetical protein AAF292_03155 [Pseudomonadota bacterium]